MLPGYISSNSLLLTYCFHYISDCDHTGSSISLGLVSLFTLVNLYILIHIFRPFIFKVIIDRVVSLSCLQLFFIHHTFFLLFFAPPHVLTSLVLTAFYMILFICSLSVPMILLLIFYSYLEFSKYIFN